MENILPFLLALAALAYKIYDNFKQEQEKARKRNPAAPHSEIPGHPGIPPISAKEVHVREVNPKPVIVEEEYFPEHRYEPVYKTNYREARPEQVYTEPAYKPMKSEIRAIKENVNPERPVEEVKRTRAIHQPHKHGVKVFKEVVYAHPYANFDLHDAVVKEAILNRPQF